MAATQGENIYNLIPHEEYQHSKSTRYTSKFKSSVTHDPSVKKFSHRTMGEAVATLPKPDDFLKRRRCRAGEDEDQICPAVCSDGELGDATQLQQERSKSGPVQERKPAVPRRDERPFMGLKTTKNFITQNVVENIMSVPKKPQKTMVDTRKGDTFPLEPSGLEPQYLKKKEYGKVPEYIIQRHEDLERSKAEYDQYVSEMQRRGEMYKVSNEEREVILDGLKKNWEDLYHQYQSLSVVVDTVPKKHRKELLENQMKTLERDIETVEKHHIIYVGY